MMNTTPLRTRFAPSPTGQLHLGGARTALFAYLLAKSTGGQFVLRIEDTDQRRFVQGSEEGIVKGLEWLGLIPDESPLRGGAYGPYRQSERLDIYRKYVDILLQKNAAYHCFCTSEELQKMREKQIAHKQAPKYDGRCRKFSPDDVAKKIQDGQSFVVRMAVPKTGETVLHDAIRGTVTFHHKDLDDQVILKSDGFPTYHLAVVVDDHLMNINMSVRSEEWLPSTPKHILLYKAFDWDLPTFAHLPMVLNEKKSKLSKRKDGKAVWVETYRELGYMPEAVVNFLAFLGWNPKTTQEIFSLNELVKIFDIKHVNKAGAVFDIARLNHVNGLYLRKLPPDALRDKAIPFLEAKDLITADGDVIKTQSGREVSLELLSRVVGLERDRMDVVSDVGEATRFFFVEDLDYAGTDLVWKKSDAARTKKVLTEAYALLEALHDDDYIARTLEKKIFAHIQKNAWGNGDFLWPMRFALTGQKASPSPFECLEVLGKHESLRRIRDGLGKL